MEQRNEIRKLLKRLKKQKNCLKKHFNYLHLSIIYTLLLKVGNSLKA